MCRVFLLSPQRNRTVSAGLAPAERRLAGYSGVPTMPPDPIYTADNVRIAYELRWSVAVFWKQPAPLPSSWLQPLQQATEPDGVRILEHRFTKDNVSQFLVSTKPHVAPAQCLRSVKGRLQYLVRGTLPKAFR